VFAHSPLERIWSYPAELEGELDAETDDRLVVVVAKDIPGSVSEDAHAACGRETEVKATTDEEVAAGISIGGEATANHGVRGQAKAGDGVAQDECGIKLVMFAVRCVETIGALEGNIRGESVFTKNAATESVFVAENSATESTEHEARSEALAAGWCWRWHYGSLRVLVGDGTSDSSTAESNCCEDGEE
jgi:hypothetical protein